jgi:predicted nucleic acid-binding protein
VNVLVDTSVWSLALRRRAQKLSPSEQTLVSELAELVQEGRAKIIGIVRQELLSGIKNQGQFAELQRTLRAFTDETVNTEDYERAALASNRCRAAGVACTLADMLICAIAEARGWEIFTRDSDFQGYAAVLSIKLHAPRT